MAKLYGMDLGGSGIRYAELHPETLELVGLPTKIDLKEFKESRKLTDFLLSEIPIGSQVGIGAAGNLDPVNLVIAESPNVGLKGELDFPAALARSERTVALTNDMPAGMMGAAVSKMGLTPFWFTNHGSGYNAGYCSEGIPFGSDPLRPNQKVLFELGHVTFNPTKRMQSHSNGIREFVCPGSCGGINHLEAVAAGSSGNKLLSALLKTQKLNHWETLIFSNTMKRLGEDYRGQRIEQTTIDSLTPHVTSSDIFNAYRQSQKWPQDAIYEMQTEGVGLALATMASVFNAKPTPKYIVAIGSFALGERPLMQQARDRFVMGDYSAGLPSMRQAVRNANPTLVFHDDTYVVMKGGAANLIAATEPAKYKEMLRRVK